MCYCLFVCVNLYGFNVCCCLFIFLYVYVRIIRQKQLCNQPEILQYPDLLMDVLSSAQLQSKELLQPAKAQSVTWIGFLTEAAMISVSYA